MRRYEPYLVAEVDMPGSRPVAGDGFNDLAGYIFGGNQSNIVALHVASLGLSEHNLISCASFAHREQPKLENGDDLSGLHFG